MALPVPSAVASLVRPGDRVSGATTSAEREVSYSLVGGLTNIWLDSSAEQAGANVVRSKLRLFGL